MKTADELREVSDHINKKAKHEAEELAQDLYLKVLAECRLSCYAGSYSHSHNTATFIPKTTRRCLEVLFQKQGFYADVSSYNIYVSWE